MELLDRLEESIIITDKNGGVKYSNDSARLLFDVEKEKRITTIFKPDDREIFFVNLMRIVEKHGKYHNFIRFISGQGNLIFCWLNAFTYNGDIVFEIFDLSKTSSNNTNINDDNYVRLLKYMSEGVAHSIRNPVMSAGGMLNRLKSKLPKETSSSILSYIEIVEKSLYKIMHIIANIEVISNSLPASLKKIDLSEIARSVAQKYEKFDNITINIKAQEGVEIYADDSHIAFVIEEIMKNSYDASGGEAVVIDIEVIKEQEKAVVVISDNGPGIEDENIPLVMIPFYSTKPSNMGVGLSLSKFIVEGYGGRIEIDSKKGEGTTLTVTLPVEKRNILRREVVNV